MPTPVHHDDVDSDVGMGVKKYTENAAKKDARVKSDANKPLYAYRLLQGQRLQRDVTAEPDDNGEYPKETINGGQRFYSHDKDIAKRDGPDRVQYLGQVKDKEVVCRKERERKAPTGGNPVVSPDRNTRSITDQQTNAARHPLNEASELTQAKLAENPDIRNDDPDGSDDPRFSNKSKARATNSGGTDTGPLESQWGDFENHSANDLRDICKEAGVQVKGKQTKEGMIAALRERDQQLMTENQQEKGDLEQ